MNLTNKEYITSHLLGLSPFKDGREFHLNKVEFHSRNTILYRITFDGEKYVGKVSTSKSKEVNREEYNQLIDLNKKFKASDVRPLRPLMFDSHLGILITKEEKGATLSELIAQDLAGKYNKEAGEDIHKYFKQAASALYRFHKVCSYNHQKNKTPSVKQYLDFSPSNLLLTEDDKIILLDPPEFQKEGSPYFDVGTFCFELGRCFLKASQFSSSSHIKANRLKLTFIRKYIELWGLELNNDIVDEVKLFEKVRADTVLGYYSNFSRYKNKIREFIRYFIYSPIIYYYRNVLLPKSYEWIKHSY